MKKSRPTTVEKIQAKQASTGIAPHDIQNVVHAARMALAQLPRDALGAVTASIVNLETALAAIAKPQPDQAPQAAPDAKV